VNDKIAGGIDREATEAALATVLSDTQAKLITLVIDRNLTNFMRNTKRIDGLIKIAEELESDEEHRSDILRAAVVFLHAIIEELLRGIALVYLPISSEETLNKIPIAGSSDPLRADKFFLGRLSQHREKTVDELIKASVIEHVGRRSFSDTDEVCGLLKSLSFDVKKIKAELPMIESLMQRRHQIVHRSDVASGASQPSKINADDIAKWRKAVEKLVYSVTAEDLVRNLPDDFKTSNEDKPTGNPTGEDNKPTG
jgi:hypothetical protein